MRAETIKTGLLILFLLIFQLIGAYNSEVLPNFQPVAALLFCGFVSMNSKLSWVSLIAWFLSYPVATKLNGDYAILSKTLVVQLVAFALIIGFAKRFAKKSDFKPNFATYLTGGIASAILFYLVTNTYSWLSYSLYTKDLKGFYEAFWSGPVNSAIPTWHFFRNALAANALFTSLYWVSTKTFVKNESPVSQAILTK